MKREGYDMDLVWEQIKDAAVKTLLSAQPMLQHVYKSCSS